MGYDEIATHLWASADEAHERFLDETVPTYDFLVYDETDNGEFITTAKVDLIERGKVVLTETFVASSEDAPSGRFSAYGNGYDNHAGTLARSYAWAWIEARQEPVLFASEWVREMEEHYACADPRDDAC